MITKEVDYGLRAMLCLAQHCGEAQRLSAADIAEQMDIPYRFLRNIIRLLVEEGLVDSRRGNGGGLSLAISPEKLSLYDIVQAINPRSCVLNTCLMGEGECSRDKVCPIHNQLVELQTVVDDKLKSIKFQTLLEGC